MKIKKKNNTLLILPYPGQGKRATWWNNKYFKNLYIISTIPLIYKKTSSQLVVVSRNKPLLEGNNSFFYLSPNIFKEKGLKQIGQLKNNYLYLSTNLLNYNKLKFIGAAPNLKT